MNATTKSTAHPAPEPSADRAGLHRHRIDQRPGMWLASTLLGKPAGHAHPTVESRAAQKPS